MQIQETRMRKHQTIVALALLSLTTLPAYAQDWPELNKENVGKGIGAIAGAVIGSNIGGGAGAQQPSPRVPLQGIGQVERLAGILPNHNI
jgi:hypothetical protein